MSRPLVVRRTKKFSCFSLASLKEAAIFILSSTPNLVEKSRLTKAYSEIYSSELEIYDRNGDENGHDTIVCDEYSHSLDPPDSPARYPAVTMDQMNIIQGKKYLIKVKLPGTELPVEKEIKMSSSVVTIHGICNAESFAIDLFWDIIARFTTKKEGSYTLPLQFYRDMLYIVDQEANHFFAWKTRLDELNVPFGSLPLYDGLW